MSIPPSTLSQLPLPQWAHVPGQAGDDNADHDTLWKAKVLVPPAFRGYVPARHPALRYGLALNDRGYFWEAQEILEAVWAAAPQGGRERILLRACILIANANLRLRMEKPRAAARLFGDARAELDRRELHKQTGGDGFADSFPVAALTELLKVRLARPALSKVDWVEIGVAGKS
jgi:Domain of unknown function (DUF309)